MTHSEKSYIEHYITQYERKLKSDILTYFHDDTECIEILMDSSYTLDVVYCNELPPADSLHDSLRKQRKL